MRYREFAPAEDLRDYIQYYWVFEKEAGEDLFSYDRFMPEPSPRIIFQLAGSYRMVLSDGSERSFSNVFGCGASRDTSLVTLPGYCLSVGVCFRAGGSVGLNAFSPDEVKGPFHIDSPWAARIFQRLGDVRVDAEFSIWRVILDDSFRRRLNGNRFSAGWPLIESFLAKRTGRVDLDDLVGLYGRSARCFERACRLETGYSPREFRALTRCDFARSYLFVKENPDLSDLAVGLGFYDLPHFCRTFKRWSGMTPLEYASYCAPYRSLMSDINEMRHHATRLERLQG